MYSLGQWFSVSITKKKRKEKKASKNWDVPRPFPSLTECRIGIAGESIAETVLEKDLLENRKMQEIRLGEITWHI